MSVWPLQTFADSPPAVAHCRTRGRVERAEDSKRYCSMGGKKAHRIRPWSRKKESNRPRFRIFVQSSLCSHWFGLQLSHNAILIYGFLEEKNSIFITNLFYSTESKFEKWIFSDISDFPEVKWPNFLILLGSLAQGVKVSPSSVWKQCKF